MDGQLRLFGGGAFGTGADDGQVYAGISPTRGLKVGYKGDRSPGTLDDYLWRCHGAGFVLLDVVDGTLADEQELHSVLHACFPAAVLHDPRQPREWYEPTDYRVTEHLLGWFAARRGRPFVTWRDSAAGR